MKEYTLSAQNALKHAKKYAKSLHQSYVGTEHILLGLMKEQDGLASRVMYMNGVRLENIEALIKDFVASSKLTPSTGSKPKVCLHGFRDVRPTVIRIRHYCHL